VGLSNRLDFTSVVDVNWLPAPRWTLEKALNKTLFSDDDEPLEL